MNRKNKEYKIRVKNLEELLQRERVDNESSLMALRRVLAK